MKNKCPQCGKESLKRTSTAIWERTKCNTKMAGGAYVPQTGLGKISKRAIQGASKDEFIATFKEEEVVEQPKPKAKKKVAKAKKEKEEPKAELTVDDVSDMEESVEAEETAEQEEVE